MCTCVHVRKSAVSNHDWVSRTQFWLHATPTKLLESDDQSATSQVIDFSFLTVKVFKVNKPKLEFPLLSATFLPPLEISGQSGFGNRFNFPHTKAVLYRSGCYEVMEQLVKCSVFLNVTDLNFERRDRKRHDRKLYKGTGHRMWQICCEETPPGGN